MKYHFSDINEHSFCSIVQVQSRLSINISKLTFCHILILYVRICIAEIAILDFLLHYD